MIQIPVQISFSCEANLEKVKEQLTNLKEQYPFFTFHHCFLSRKQVEEKGFSTNIVDMLDEVLGDNHVSYLDKYETFDEAKAHIKEERLKLSTITSELFVLDSGLADGVKKEIALYSHERVNFL